MDIERVNYLLIGSGRLARHFQEYFRQLRLNFETWNRRDGGELAGKLERAHRILLLISDSALEDFHKTHRNSAPQALWIHCSGALEIPGMESFHPLMTFGRNLYSLELYNQIAFVTTSSRALEEALPGLANPCVRIDSKLKARYHALCVLSGNFTTILWQKMMSELRAWDLPPEIARPYARQTIENVFADPGGALTGPLARGDLSTQERNLQALGEDPFADIYRSFQKLHTTLQRMNR